MVRDNLQLQRFELKYLVTEDVALAARDFVASYLELDEFSQGKPQNSYFNHSVYLDSEDLDLYWDVINGNINRYKLRLRYYDDDPESPIFFEIKRRSDGAIFKQRAPVRREAVQALLEGETPGPQHLHSDNPRYLAAIQRFSQLMLNLRAAPKTHVCYLREAWVTAHDNSARVTFDRDVCSVAKSVADLSTDLENPVMPWGKQVILELKFTGRFPNWFGELVRIFGVMQCGVAKYAEGVTFLGPDRVPMPAIPFGNAEAAEQFLKRRHPGAELDSLGTVTS